MKTACLTAGKSSQGSLSRSASSRVRTEGAEHLDPCLLLSQMAPCAPAPVEPWEGDSLASRAQGLRPTVACSLWAAGCDCLPLLVCQSRLVVSTVQQPLPAVLQDGRSAGASGRARRGCCMRLSGGKPGVVGDLPGVPGAGLTYLVLCAPGAAASLRGNGRRRLSVTSDRCLLGLAGTTAPAAPTLSHWKGLLFRGEEEA